jgi:hypothetical protein
VNSIVLLDDLRPHEQTSSYKVETLARDIRENGLRKPLLIDARSFTILDGHHRAKALARNGCRFAKAFIVDYESKSVRILPRRKHVRVSKTLVVKRALSGKLFPRKTTRHVLVRTFVTSNPRSNRKH